jgi:hypothetical protein
MGDDRGALGCPSRLLYCRCLVKQSQAPLGSNLTRDNQAEGRVNGAAALARQTARAAFFVPLNARAYALKNPTVALAQRREPPEGSAGEAHALGLTFTTPRSVPRNRPACQCLI